MVIHSPGETLGENAAASDAEKKNGCFTVSGNAPSATSGAYPNAACTLGPLPPSPNTRSMRPSPFRSVPATTHGAEGLFHALTERDRKSTRLNSSHLGISYAVFCLKK